MKIRALEVSELNIYVKRLLINDPVLNNIKLKGEISNLKKHSSGNVYLSLKDSTSKVNCIIFKSDYKKDFNLEVGSKVIVTGYLSGYVANGSYQVYIKNIEDEGVGDLHKKFLILKQKLEKQGYFDKNKKKKIPNMPKVIGVVTSETGAVIRDICNVIKRRYPKVAIKLYPVHVQGEKAAEQIVRGIEFFNLKNEADIIIVGRGGGSMEELWSFNEEIVADSIYKSNIPIISAVGHETDFTICDFVSDLRAPTPSAAAELATPSMLDLEFKLKNVRQKIEKDILSKMEVEKYKTKNIIQKIENYMQNYVIKDNCIKLDFMHNEIVNLMQNNIENKKLNLKNGVLMLETLSPLATLKRGYSILESKEKRISSINQIEKDDVLKITLNDGQANCKVESIEKNTINI